MRYQTLAFFKDPQNCPILYSLKPLLSPDKRCGLDIELLRV
ncbi:MAG TPA: hypothetical protein VMM84_05805 [Pyrinomonadaceae bacterium]|nr:hypothetical protein [Pyrinomonadaceae bacterium]